MFKGLTFPAFFLIAMCISAASTATNSDEGSFAASRILFNVTVSDLWVYETNDDSVHVRISLNGLRKLGENPSNLQNTCEIRTYSKTVYSALVAAMHTQSKVDVEYVDTSNGGISCKVYAVTTKKE